MPKAPPAPWPSAVALATGASLPQLVEMAQALGREAYINLESFKRDGTGVKTPVWCAELDDTLVVFTLVESFKVKRIARNPKVRIAACDVRGKLHGAWYDGECERVTDAETEKRAYAALRAKYGWQMRLGDFFSTLSGRMRRRVVLQIRLQNRA